MVNNIFRLEVESIDENNHTLVYAEKYDYNQNINSLIDGGAVCFNYEQDDSPVTSMLNDTKGAMNFSTNNMLCNISGMINFTTNSLSSTANGMGLSTTGGLNNNRGSYNVIGATATDVCGLLNEAYNPKFSTAIVNETYADQTLTFDTEQDFYDSCEEGDDLTVMLSADTAPYPKVGLYGRLLTKGSGTTVSVALGQNPFANMDFSRSTVVNGTKLSEILQNQNGVTDPADFDSITISGIQNKATGWSSFTTGVGNINNNRACAVFGRYNVGTTTDTITEVGIGIDESNRANAFEIYTDGRIHAPELTTALITNNRCLTTKEYVDANASTSFTGLVDTPSNYTGAASYKVKVNAAGNALEFVDDSEVDGGTF
jgi:hypothetical protein